MKDSIHSQGYRPLEERAISQGPWRAIATQAFSNISRQRATKVFGIFSLGVLAGHGAWLIGQILFAKATGDIGLTAMGAASILGDTREVLASFFSIQFFVMALAIATLGAGVIADEVQSDVLSVYFSRTIAQGQYIFGKSLALGMIPLLAFLVPGLILWFTALGIAPELMRNGLWGLFIPTVGLGLAGATVLTVPMVALSTLSPSHRVSAIIYLAFFLFAVPIVEGLAQSGYSAFGYLSPERAFQTLVQWAFEPEQTVAGDFFDVRSRAELESPSLAAVSLTAFVCLTGALASFGLRRRLR